MNNSPVSPVQVVGADGLKEDLLVTEEPLEIRLGHGLVDAREEIRLAVTMRTPGDDHVLAIGFLFTEGIIQGCDEVLRIEHCQQVKDDEHGNVIRVELHPDVSIDPEKWQRNFYTTSSCGVCGKSSIEAVHVQCSQVPILSSEPPLDLILELPERMRKAQVIFKHTGGIHAAALFSLSGELLLLFEDIGRHNAVDKLIGARALALHPFADTILVVSGRAGFELVQKAAVVGIPVMLSIGAPSSLSVTLAAARSLLLYGFVRHGKANRYTRLEG